MQIGERKIREDVTYTLALDILRPREKIFIVSLKYSILITDLTDYILGCYNTYSRF